MKSAARVLMVFSWLERGGAESMCMNLYRTINREKVQFDFVKHSGKKGAFEDEILELGGRIYEAPAYKIYNHVEYCKWWKKHFELHPEHQIVHGHYFTVSTVYFSVAKKMGRITIGHSHSSNIQGIVKKMMAKECEKNSDYQFACSEEAGKWLFPNSDFKVLKNAIDSSLFRFDAQKRMEIRAELGIDGEFTVGTVGNIIEVKNPIGTLKIFSHIKSKIPDAKFIWAGFGSMMGLVKQKIAEKNLQDSVLMLGSRNDIDRILHAMDIFILPSLFEGLPVSLIEAQAAGLRCVCSNAMTKEVDVTGLCSFIDIEDYSLWADAILEMKDYERMDTSAQIIDAGYDIKDTADWMEKFYLAISNL